MKFISRNFLCPAMEGSAECLLSAAAVFFLSSGFVFSNQQDSLVFSPAVGDRIAYRLDISVEVTGEDLQGKELSLGTRAAGELRMAVKRKVGDLVFTAMTVPGIDVETRTQEGTESFLLQTKENMALQASFNRSGGVHDVHNLEALNKDQVWSLSFDRIISDFLPSVAGKTVMIGESWSDHKSLIFPFQGLDLEVSVKRTYVLENIVSAAQGELAVISMTYDVDLTGSKKWEDWEAVIEGSGTGGGQMNYLIGRNCFQEFQADYQTKAVLTVRHGGKAYAERPFHLSVSADLLLINQPHSFIKNVD